MYTAVSEMSKVNVPIRQFILGSNGNLGRSITKLYDDYSPMQVISRVDCINWESERSIAEIRDYFRARTDNHEKNRLYICSGITDPDQRNLNLAINFEMPKNLILACEKLNFEFVTFGTIQEEFELSNHYIDSKRLFSNWVRTSDLPNVDNYKLHTLFGGHRFDNSMFLSQILAALLKNERFFMSSGAQIREYHHISDIAQIVDWYSKRRGISVDKISHGKPLPLRSIAEYIFERFDRLELLIIDETRSTAGENFNRVFPNTLPPGFQDRDVLPEIGDWIQKQLELERPFNEQQK